MVIIVEFTVKVSKPSLKGLKHITSSARLEHPHGKVSCFVINGGLADHRPCLFIEDHHGQVAEREKTKLVWMLSIRVVRGEK